MTGRLPKALIRPPVLAMVDAFVGGTAILLILIVLSSNLQESPGTQPQADVVLRCSEGAITAVPSLPAWLPDKDRIPLSEAAAWLATNPHPNRLLTRVHLEAGQQEFRCVSGFQRAIEQMNAETDDVVNRDTTQERAVLLLTVVITGPPEERAQ